MADPATQPVTQLPAIVQKYWYSVDWDIESIWKLVLPVKSIAFDKFHGTFVAVRMRHPVFRDSAASAGVPCCPCGRIQAGSNRLASLPSRRNPQPGPPHDSRRRPSPGEGAIDRVGGYTCPPSAVRELRGGRGVSGRDELWVYKKLDGYSEAQFLSELVAAGELPPVQERLPEEPLVHLTGAMSDGIGEYGGVFRRVFGGRPEGWNWMAGQHQGSGGINMAVQECLVRDGPLWPVKAEDQPVPLSNLATSWEWNDDKTTLTLKLVAGAHWSDGDLFDAEDVRFGERTTSSIQM